MQIQAIFYYSGKTMTFYQRRKPTPGFFVFIECQLAVFVLGSCITYSRAVPYSAVLQCGRIRGIYNACFPSIHFVAVLRGTPPAIAICRYSGFFLLEVAAV